MDIDQIDKSHHELINRKPPGELPIERQHLHPQPHEPGSERGAGTATPADIAAADPTQGTPQPTVESTPDDASDLVDRNHDRRWWTLAVMCLTLVLISVDNTILNVAIPTLAREFDASASQLQWIVDSYVLVFAGLLLTGGFLGDKYGRRGALMIGMAIFGVGSIAASMAGSANQLIACRALMGAGGALIMPATLSILNNPFRDAKERAKAIAIWAGCSGLGVALGPVTGGWLLEHFDWGWVFLVNVPVLIAAIAGCVFIVPTSKDEDAPRVDIGGAVLSIAGLPAVLWAIIEAPEQGWTSTRTLVAFAVAGGLIAAFLEWESRQDHPMLNIGVFRSRRFSAASGAVTLTFFALFGTLFLVTQYMQSVMGYTALQSGVRYLPLAGTLLVVSPISAKPAARYGSKPVVASGLGTVSIGLLLMLRLEADTGYAPLLTSMMVLATGMGLTMAPATESIMGSLPPARAGVGSAVNDTTREVGGALGVAVLGSVLSSIFAGRMNETLASQPLPAEAAAAEHSVTGAVRRRIGNRRRVRRRPRRRRQGGIRRRPPRNQPRRRRVRLRRGAHRPDLPARYRTGRRPTPRPERHRHARTPTRLRPGNPTNPPTNPLHPETEPTMPMIDLTVEADALDETARDQLAQDLLAALLRWEGAPDNPRSRSLAWAFVHVVDRIQVAEPTSNRAHYRIGVRTPAGALDDRRREGLIAEAMALVLKAEGLNPNPTDAFRVWVILDEIANGSWGAQGNVWRLTDIAAFVTAPTPEDAVAR